MRGAYVSGWRVSFPGLCKLHRKASGCTRQFIFLKYFSLKFELDNRRNRTTLIASKNFHQRAVSA